MSANIPQILQDKWPILTANGLTRLATYQELTVAVYDASTKVIDQTVVSSHSIQMVWDEFSFTENKAAIHKFDDSPILSIDRIVIFPSLDLPVEPSVNDRIVDDSSNEWSVLGISKDPAGAHYELHVRPANA